MPARKRKGPPDPVDYWHPTNAGDSWRAFEVESGNVVAQIWREPTSSAPNVFPGGHLVAVVEAEDLEPINGEPAKRVVFSGVGDLEEIKAECLRHIPQCFPLAPFKKKLAEGVDGA